MNFICLLYFLLLANLVNVPNPYLASSVILSDAAFDFNRFVWNAVSLILKRRRYVFVPSDSL